MPKVLPKGNFHKHFQNMEMSVWRIGIERNRDCGMWRGR